MRHLALGYGVVLVLMLTGCGSSGGDSGGGGDKLTTVDGGSAYTGSRDDAVVEAKSGGEFGAVTNTGFEIGQGVVGFVDLDSFQLNRTAAAARTVFSPAADVAASLRNGERVLARTDVATEYGSCGGEMTRTVETPDTIQVPITIKGTADFEGYCDDGVTVDGLVRFLVTIDPDFTIDLTETLSGVAVSIPDEQNPGEIQHLLLTGTVTATVEAFGEGVMTINLNVEDLNDSAMVWFDYTVDLVPGPGFGQETMDVSGDVYHSVHGRVSVTTKPSSSPASEYVFPEGAVASLVRDANAETLLSGGILIEGEKGSAAIISVLSEADGDAQDGYEVVLDDAAPEGTFDEFDTVLGPIPWQ